MMKASRSVQETIRTIHLGVYIVARFLVKEPPERSRLFFIALLLIDILPTSPQLELVPFSRREGEEKIS